MSAPVLVVDRRGLARKLAGKPKAFIVYELLQNAWDEEVRTVSVTVEAVAGRPEVVVSVEDDCPNGFADLSSVYTMFKDSKKSPDPTKRGRFELGEKLVLALALEASVTSTKGSVIIEGDTRRRGRKRRDAGTLFTGRFRMTRDEFAVLDAEVKTLIPPAGITTTYNGKELVWRRPLHAFRTTLRTLRSDEEGALRSTYRLADVHIHNPLPGEEGTIYEMGIPVCRTGDRYHYDVGQRVPVNWERNNVPASFLRDLRVHTLNEVHGKLTKVEAVEDWVTEAISDERCSPEALTTVKDLRFGKRSVVYDPSDPEANKIAMSEGHTVIPRGSLPAGAWANFRNHGTVRPAGQVTPSPKPYDPNGEPERLIDEEDWTPDQRRVVELSIRVFRYLIGKELRVRIAKEPGVRWSANFGQGQLCLNAGKLSRSWWARTNDDPEILSLLIHEFVHHTVSDHLSHKMHETACLLGAKLVRVALKHPQVFGEDK